jgi:tRNA modification GTPase
VNPTIFAPATAPGRGAVAIIRISGPLTRAALACIAGPPDLTPRKAHLRRLRTTSGELIDEGLILWFPAPASYTGEDSAEFQVHGGPAVLAALSDTLVEAGLRPAEPGEFTRRAFAHGRIDLAQAEAVADLVAAETDQQRRQALEQLAGGLSARYDAWRDALLDTLALLEAAVDFPDEDIPEATLDDADRRLVRYADEMAEAAADRRGERVRDGVRVALVGAPNAGKSSLLNALLGRSAAIVTDIAGTTRDVVEAPIAVAGQLVILADTAGLRATADLIEQEGVRRAKAWAEAADLRIGVVDRTRPETYVEAQSLLRGGDILALNKSDLPGSEAPSATWDLRAVPTVATSDGVQALRAALAERVGAVTGARAMPAVTQARHRALLQSAVAHLRRASEDLRRGPELAAENVRLALRNLEQVTGRSHPEAVLDRVFAGFCIGK